MSSSFLFNQSPDWAKIIGDSYASVNASEEYNESLERENDKRRIENAGMPLKMIKGIAEFSATAKKLANAMDEKADDNAEKEYWFGKGAFDKPTETNTALNNAAEIGLKSDNEVIATHEQNKNYSAAEAVEQGSIFKTRHQKRVELKNWTGNIDNTFYREIGRFTTKSGKKYGDNLTGAEFNEIYTKWLSETFIQPLMDRGLNAGFIKEHAFDAVKKHKSSLMLKNKQAIEQRWLTQQTEKKTEGIRSIFNSDDYLNEFVKSVEIDSPRYEMGGNKGKKLAAEDKIMTAIALANAGDENVTHAKIRALLGKYKIQHAGSGEVLYTKQFKDINLKFETALIQGEAKRLELKEQDDQNYAGSFEQDIQTIEDKRGSLLTNKELADYLRENWDKSRGAIPDSIKGRLTKEDHDDDIQLEYIEHLHDLNILDKAEVYKLNDGKLREEWLKKAAEGNPSAANSTQIKQAKKKAEGFANKRAKQFGVRPGKENDQWNNIVINAENQFPALYKEAMKTANSEADAFKTATDQMEQLIKDGDYDELLTTESDPLKRSRNLFRAQKHIEINPDIVNTGIIWGSEEILEAAKDLPPGQVHLFYKQLGNKLKVLPEKIQRNQLAIAAKLKGEKEPAKSEILLAWEKLPETSQELLSHHVDPARVIRAKIEAFKDDAQIDYNEVGFLFYEIINDPATYPEFATTETVIEPPKERRVDRRSTRPKTSDGQAAEELKDFVGNMVTGVMEYPSDLFATEIESIKQFGEAIEERKEKVKKRPKTRKR